jgi:hypothetical protein
MGSAAGEMDTVPVASVSEDVVPISLSTKLTSLDEMNISGGAELTAYFRTPLVPILSHGALAALADGGKQRILTSHGEENDSRLHYKDVMSAIQRMEDTVRPLLVRVCILTYLCIVFALKICNSFNQAT